VNHVVPVILWKKGNAPSIPAFIPVIYPELNPCEQLWDVLKDMERV